MSNGYHLSTLMPVHFNSYKGAAMVEVSIRILQFLYSCMLFLRLSHIALLYSLSLAPSHIFHSFHSCILFLCPSYIFHFSHSCILLFGLSYPSSFTLASCFCLSHIPVLSLLHPVSLSLSLSHISQHYSPISQGIVLSHSHSGGTCKWDEINK